MTTRTKSTPQRPGIAELCTVLYIHEESTPWSEVYRASSDTTIGRRYRVVYEPEPKTWRCECVGAQHHGHCRHIRRCDRLRRIRTFSALWAGQSPATLRRHLAHYQERVASSNADDDDLAALDYLEMRLENQQAA